MDATAIKVRLRRGFSDSRCTLGIVQIEGIKHDPFFTLENPERDTTHDSRIPAGAYLCKPYKSSKYPVAWEVMDVPGRTAILIHNGNYESETLGCILLGLTAQTLAGDPMVGSSKDAIAEFQRLLSNQTFTLVVE